MCRMFGYVGRSREDLQRLLEALRKSARRDTVASSLGIGSVHADGWGFAIYSDGGLSFYKSKRPVFDDDMAIPETKGSIYAIFHARKASDKKTVESRFNHPFFGDDESSFIFFAHNGALEKDRLERKVGFSGRATDSELAFKYLLRNGLGAADELEGYTTPNSALNLLILKVDRKEGAEVFVKEFYNKVQGDKDKSRYYAILQQELSGGRAVFSSTFNEYGLSGKELARPGLVSIASLIGCADEFQSKPDPSPLPRHLYRARLDDSTMKREFSDVGASTRALWAGEEKSLMEHSTQVPIVQSVAFGYQDLDEWREVALGRRHGHIYSRNTNPTVAVFEEKVRALEDAEAATSFSTGMAAVSNVLFALLKPGDRVVSVKDTYGGTNQLFREFLPRARMDVTLSETTDFEEIEAEVAKGCRLVYLETPTNPTLKVVDILRISRASHAVGATVVTDNTFATPINQSPLMLGSDIVLHSATKFLGGHADALGGVACGPSDLVRQVFHYREITGAALDPFAAYLLLRGMKTLGVRVERQNASAMKIAEYLEGRREVARVYYPGLKSHPQHEIAKRQMRGGFGGVLSFTLKGGFSAVKRFLPRLKYAHMAANLGAVETTVGTPATTSHVEVSARDRAAMGIPEALVRYSTGIEDVADLIRDLEQALAQL